MSNAKSSTIAPEWANRITADLPLTQVGIMAPEAIAKELKRYSNEVVSLIWRRLSKETKLWLTQWWQS